MIAVLVTCLIILVNWGFYVLVLARSNKDATKSKKATSFSSGFQLYYLRCL